jgi:hypothetical protein
MKLVIRKFFGCQIVARYYVNLETFSLKEAKEIVNKVMQSDAKLKYLTASEYLISFKDEYGYSVTYEKSLDFIHNLERANENIERIWRSLQNLQKEVSSEKNIVIEISRKS